VRIGGVGAQVGVVSRRLTDPRATLAVLTLALAAAVAAGNLIVAGFAIGGLAGFSLSGSP
jgi:hypothetical protein